MALAIQSITSDPRYVQLLEDYSADWGLAMEVFFGKSPSFQQDEILDSVYKENSQTSIASGTGTGKSDLASIMIILFMIFHPDARVTIVAAKISVVKAAIWGYMFNNFAVLEKRFPWIAHYFTLTETEFYERSKKLTWVVKCKGYRINNEQSLAGEHADHMLQILDEASIVSDSAWSTMLATQTGLDNRFLAMSQPTRNGGYYYETHHSKTIENGGMWNAIRLSSDESEWVKPAFIVNALNEFGGYDSPEFQIKVLGKFTEQQSEFLLTRGECQKAIGATVKLDAEWGWVATCDVGVRRDRSIINICKVSGAIGNKRVVEDYKIIEVAADFGVNNFARKIVNECCNGLYPNITIAIDADGVGVSVWEKVIEMVADGEHDDVTVQAVHWGKPPFTKRQKARFKNLRAMAHVYASEALRDGRMSLDSHLKTIDQFSKLPYSMNAGGQYVMMRKEDMKRKHQIPSPDRSDTYCFTQIINYREAGIEEFQDDIDTNDMNDWLALDVHNNENEGLDSENWELIGEGQDNAERYRDWDRTGAPEAEVLEVFDMEMK